MLCILTVPMSRRRVTAAMCRKGAGVDEEDTGGDCWMVDVTVDVNVVVLARMVGVVVVVVGSSVVVALVGVGAGWNESSV